MRFSTISLEDAPSSKRLQNGRSATRSSEQKRYFATGVVAAFRAASLSHELQNFFVEPVGPATQAWPTLWYEQSASTVHSSPPRYHTWFLRFDRVAFGAPSKTS